MQRHICYGKENKGGNTKYKQGKAMENKALIKHKKLLLICSPPLPSFYLECLSPNRSSVLIVPACNYRRRPGYLQGVSVPSGRATLCVPPVKELQEEAANLQAEGENPGGGAHRCDGKVGQALALFWGSIYIISGNKNLYLG